MAGDTTSTKNQTSNDQAKITITKDGMTATVMVRSPKSDEFPVSAKQILDQAASAGIVFGLDRSAVQRVVEQNLVNQPVIIAQGKPPMRGDPSKFVFHFDTSCSHRPVEDANGRVDFKNINFIQSVSEGDVLVTKIPATTGTMGKDILGKQLRAPSGADLPFRKGANTKVSEDGLKLLAAEDGVIFYANGIVAVKDVTVINSDVDFGVGNIDSKASIQIHGDVRTGFSVKTSGDIEVNGMVEDADLEAEGDIFVSGGIFGQGEGEVKAGGDITAKFVENHRLTAGNSITLGESAVNSRITAGNEFRISSSHGRIVGGRCAAGALIEVAKAGSPAGTSTILQINLDVERLHAIEETVATIARVKEDEKRVAEAVNQLNQVRAEGKLPAEKIPQLEELIKIRDNFPEQIEQLEAKVEQIRQELGAKLQPQIRITKSLHSGAIVRFGESQKTIIDESGPGSFELNDKQIEFKRG